MKFKIRYVLIPFASLAVISLLLLAFLHYKRIALVQDHYNELKLQAMEGDILCRLGDRTWSLYFKGLSKEDKRFSHLGIIHIKDGIITVINSEGLFWEGSDCVSETPLDKFIEPARMLGLYRLEGVDGKAITDEALKMIGRPFDWDFDLTNDNKIYCTELLYVALKTAAPEIKLKTTHKFGKDIIPLEAVSSSSQFKEVLFLE